jgi:acyl carrier protein
MFSEPLSPTLHAMSLDRTDLLAEVFRAVFEFGDEIDVSTMSQEATEAWDSLAHVSLTTALESEFDVEITVADSIEMSSFEAVVEILDELLSE